MTVTFFTTNGSAYCKYYYRIEQPILNSLGGSWWCFSVRTPQTWMDLDETWNISVETWCELTQKFLGKLSQGFCQTAPKCVLLFLCQQYNAALQTLILHRFRPRLKQQTWIAVLEPTSMKNFWFSVEGFWKPQKSAPEAVFWVGCSLPMYSSNSTISGDRNHSGGYSWGVRFGRYDPQIKGIPS